MLLADIAIFCACTARFVSDLFGNHIVCFLTRRLRFNLHEVAQPFIVTMGAMGGPITDIMSWETYCRVQTPIVQRTDITICKKCDKLCHCLNALTCALRKDRTQHQEVALRATIAHLSQQVQIMEKRSNFSGVLCRT